MGIIWECKQETTSFDPKRARTPVVLMQRAFQGFLAHYLVTNPLFLG